MKKLVFTMLLAASGFAQASGKSEILSGINDGVKALKEVLVQKALRSSADSAKVAAQLSELGFKQSFIARNVSNPEFINAMMETYHFDTRIGREFKPINLANSSLDDDINLLRIANAYMYGSIDMGYVFSALRKAAFVSKKEDEEIDLVNALDNGVLDSIKGKLKGILRLVGLFSKENNKKPVNLTIDGVTSKVLETVMEIEFETPVNQAKIIELIDAIEDSYIHANKEVFENLSDHEILTGFFVAYTKAFDISLSGLKADQFEVLMKVFSDKFSYVVYKAEESGTLKSALKVFFRLYEKHDRKIDSLFYRELLTAVRQEIMVCGDKVNVCEAIDDSELFRAVVELAEADPKFAKWFDEVIMKELDK